MINGELEKTELGSSKRTTSAENLPMSVSVAELAQQNQARWEQRGGEMFQNDESGSPNQMTSKQPAESSDYEKGCLCKPERNTADPRTLGRVFAGNSDLREAFGPSVPGEEE